jgi:hypothetical protein
MKKVLEAYVTALEVVRGMGFEDAMEYLRSKYLHTGICLYCRINNIDFQVMDDDYIFNIPYYCTTHAEIIETLEFRIKYLKENYEKTF